MKRDCLKLNVVIVDDGNYQLIFQKKGRKKEQVKVLGA